MLRQDFQIMQTRIPCEDLLKVEAGGKSDRVLFLSKQNKMIEARLREPDGSGENQGLVDVKVSDTLQNLIFAKITPDEKLVTVE